MVGSNAQCHAAVVSKAEVGIILQHKHMAAAHVLVPAVKLRHVNLNHVRHQRPRQSQLPCQRQCQRRYQHQRPRQCQHWYQRRYQRLYLTQHAQTSAWLPAAHKVVMIMEVQHSRVHLKVSSARTIARRCLMILCAIVDQGPTMRHRWMKCLIAVVVE